MLKKILLSLLSFFGASISQIEGANQEINPSQYNEFFIDVEGDAKLFCRTIGKGNPLIVIHGGPGLTQDYLLPYLNKLAENNFVIFYDQRGCGRSTGEINPNTINVPTFLKDLDSIRKFFNFEKVSILGHSWGGFLAMHYAIGYTKSVDKLILSNSNPATSEGVTLFVNEFVRRTTPIQEQLSAIYNDERYAKGDPEVVERRYNLIFQTYCHIPEKANLLNIRMTPTAAVNGSKVYELIAGEAFKKPFNLNESLKTLKNPTLVIHGDDDPVPAITAQNIHENIPGSKYILLKNCGHFPYVEQPDAYFSSLKEFLN